MRGPFFALYLALAATTLATSPNKLKGNAPYTAVGAWDNCDNWTEGCPANHPALGATINLDVTFSKTDPDGYVPR